MGHERDSYPVVVHVLTADWARDSRQRISVRPVRNPESDRIAKMANKVLHELRRYPDAVLSTHVQCVVLVSDMQIDGASAAAVSHCEGRAIFLGEDLLTMNRLDRALHHEMGHLLWCAMRPEDRSVWRGLRGAQFLPSSPKVEGRRKPGRLESGLLSRFADESASEDWATFIEHDMSVSPIERTPSLCLSHAAAAKAAFAHGYLDWLGADVTDLPCIDPVGSDGVLPSTPL